MTKKKLVKLRGESYRLKLQSSQEEKNLENNLKDWRISEILGAWRSFQGENGVMEGEKTKMEVLKKWKRDKWQEICHLLHEGVRMVHNPHTHVPPSVRATHQAAHSSVKGVQAVHRTGTMLVCQETSKISLLD